MNISKRELKKLRRLGKRIYGCSSFHSATFDDFAAFDATRRTKQEILDLCINTIPDVYIDMAVKNIPHFQVLSRGPLKDVGRGEGCYLVTKGLDVLLCPWIYSQVIEFRRIQPNVVEFLMWHNRRQPKSGRKQEDMKFSLDPSVVKSHSGITKPLRGLFQCRLEEGRERTNVSMDFAWWRWTGVAKEILAFYVMQFQVGGRITKSLRVPCWKTSFESFHEIAAEKKRKEMEENKDKDREQEEKKKKEQQSQKYLNPLLEAIESIML